MADLNVQPKQKKSLLPWLLLALGIIALIYFLGKGCNNDKGNGAATDSVSAVNSNSTTSTDTASNATATATTGAGTGAAWADVDFNVPAAAYGEITDKNIGVRGNNNYAIYSLGENILFDEGKNTVKTDAGKNLKQVASSIDKRFKGASVRVFGYTDSIGSAGYNKELAEQRAEAVKNWLVKNGNIPEDKISLEPVGKSHPVASNASSQGREKNRRVEIVARMDQNGK